MKRVAEILDNANCEGTIFRSNNAGAGSVRHNFRAWSLRKFNRLRRNSLLKKTGIFQIGCREDFSTNRDVFGLRERCLPTGVKQT
jgi:hypothetical protein